MTRPPGLGVDLIEVERIERALERRPSLRRRLFTDHELEACASRARPGRHLAARFAAKEAALKALGIGGLRMREVEVAGGVDRPPRLDLHGSVAAEAARQGVRLEVSLSHSRELATAIVIAERAG